MFRIVVALILSVGVAEGGRAETPSAGDTYPALVKYDGKCGFIDAEGEFVIKPEYDAAGEFDRSGFAWVSKEGDSRLISKDGSTRFTLPRGSVLGAFYNNEIAILTLDNRITRIDYLGRVPPSEYKPTKLVGDFQYTPYALAYTYSRKYGENLGVVDRQLDWVIKPYYKEFSRFDGNSLFVLDKEGSWFRQHRNGELKKFDYSGPKLGSFESIGESGKAIAYIGNGSEPAVYGIIAEDGRWLIQPVYQEIRFRPELGRIFAKKNGVAGFLSLDGNFTPNELAASYGWRFKGKRIVKKEGDKVGLTDAQGRWIVKPKFEAVGYCNRPLSPPLPFNMPYHPEQAPDY
ncbi:MAG: WG repeat-containing protein [Pseudomonadota bacterium]